MKGLGRRLIVVLTRDEAAALLTRFALDPQTASLTGLAKIRTALERVNPRLLPRRPPRPTPRTPITVAPDGQACTPTRTSTRVITRHDAPAVDDYVPWRDEANGAWE